MKTGGRRRTAFCVAASLLAFVVAPGCGGRSSRPLEYKMANAEVIRGEFALGGGGGDSGPNPLEDPNRTAQWATITGVVKIDGDPPPRRPVTVDKEQSVCAPSGPPLDEEVVVGPNGGIKNVLIFLNTDLPKSDADEAEPVWVHPSFSLQKNPGLQQVVFDQKQCVFLTHVLAMRSDQTMLIKNSDPVGHNTNIAANDAVGINTTVPASGSVLHRPLRQERLPIKVSCNVHTWMSAWMITRDNPYFAVTDENGQFKIENIPAGVPLSFLVWQEKCQRVEPKSVVGAPSEWSRGIFEITLADNESRQIEITIDASQFK